MTLNLISEYMLKPIEQVKEYTPLEWTFLRLKELMVDQDYTPQGLTLFVPLPDNTEAILDWGGISGLAKTFSREWTQKSVHIQLMFVWYSLRKIYT